MAEIQRMVAILLKTAFAKLEETRTKQLVLERKLRVEVLSFVHESNPSDHLGLKRTMALIKYSSFLASNRG